MYAMRPNCFATQRYLNISISRKLSTPLYACKPRKTSVRRGDSMLSSCCPSDLTVRLSYSLLFRRFRFAILIGDGWQVRSYQYPHIDREKNQQLCFHLLHKSTHSERSLLISRTIERRAAPLIHWLATFAQALKTHWNR